MLFPGCPVTGPFRTPAMKVCPKCHSTFTDETLSFCLTDGTPLIHKDIGLENVSSEFSNANTVFDSDSTLFSSVSHTTDPQSHAQQTQFLSNPQVAASGSGKSPMLYVLLTVVVLAAVGGGAFWLFRDSFRQMVDPPHEVIRSSEAKKTTAPLTAEQEDQIRREIEAFLSSWKASIEKRDINDQMRHYAKTLETFYRDSDKDQNHVRAERLKAFERYESLSLDFTNVKVTPASDKFATVTFDKSWVFRNKDRFSSGAVEQEMGLVKSGGRWFIVIEKDLQTYNINNRQNNNNNSNSNSNSNTNANQ